MIEAANHELIWDRWLRNADRSPDGEAVVVWKAGEEPLRWTWSALIAEATRYGRELQEAGVRPGEVCALVLRHQSGFYPLYMGVSSIGAIPAVLAYPNSRLHPEKFREGLTGMSVHSGLDWVLTEEALRPALEPLLAAASSTVRGVLCPLTTQARTQEEQATRQVASSRSTPDTTCLLQHSSGTTGLQKAVALSHREVLGHLASYGRALRLQDSDKVVSWLPLYHDMGLIAGFHLPLALAIPTVQLDPFEWISAPALLLDVLSRERGTLCWLPNFAFSFMAQRVRDDDLDGVTLGHVRQLINCSEPVRAESQDAFFERFRRQGLQRKAMAACYAMAETTFAVTQTEAGDEPRRFNADRGGLARGEALPAVADAGTRVCLSSGKPIDGCQVRVIDDSGAAMPDGQVGELEIRSRFLFNGYRGQPEKTASALRDGWLLSGDLGFVHQGETYVVGRKKDLIIVAGKNLVPDDIEDALNGLQGIIPGRVVAFGLEDPEAGTELVAVVAETDLTAKADRKNLRLKILQRAMEVDVTVSRVYLAPPRWLVKSSAGKPSRAANRVRALAELNPSEEARP